MAKAEAKTPRAEVQKATITSLGYPLPWQPPSKHVLSLIAFSDSRLISSHLSPLPFQFRALCGPLLPEAYSEHLSLLLCVLGTSVGLSFLLWKTEYQQNTFHGGRCEDLMT